MRQRPLVAELLQPLKPFTIAKLRLVAADVKQLLAKRTAAITAGSYCCSFVGAPVVVIGEQLKRSTAAVTVEATIAAAISFDGPSFST